MTTTSRIFTAFILAVTAAGFLAVPNALADKVDGKITFEVTTEPADLGPGQSGTLIVKGVLFDKLHIYGAGDDQAMTYEAVEAKGVSYDMAKATIDKTHDWKGEFEESARPVWEKSFTLKVPVTFSKDVLAGTRVGVAFNYYGCTDRGCYPQIKGHEAVIVLKGPAPRGIAAKGPVITKDIIEEEGGASVTIEEEVEEGNETKGTIVVTFTPEFGWHFYGPAGGDKGLPIGVKPKKADGVTFGEPKPDDPAAVQIDGPYKIVIPYTRAKGSNKIEVEVSWAGCEGEGAGAKCNPPRTETFGCVWPGPGGEVSVPVMPEPPPPPAAPKGDVLFPVVADADLGAGEDEQSFIQRKMAESPILAFGIIFLLGLGLAFTPCVLPIIPITVSVISGGNADIPRRRLAALLAVYVLGLCLTFATMGVIAAQTGGAMSALFAMPAVQWGIAILFLVLGFGMFGLYELQPPAWMTKMQGGARSHSGSFVGAFLFGCLGAIIASPCTGPAIAALLIIAANEGSTVLGFSMFFMLGLGMGAVLFAAGSLNFMMRPGPWMAWVRYAFGILIVAAAMYYLRNYQLIDETAMWIVGVLVCLIAGAGIAWHLNKREGEDVRPARIRGAKVGVLTLLAIVFVAWYTRVPDNLLSWTYAESPEHLQELVVASRKKGKPVVVDFWGTWCTNCKVYDKRIASTPILRERFERITRIKVDLSGDDQVRWPMRHALGIKESGAPVMVFLDGQGRIHRSADVVGLMDAEDLVKLIDVVLKKRKPIKTTRLDKTAR